MCFELVVNGTNVLVALENDTTLQFDKKNSVLNTDFI